MNRYLVWHFDLVAGTNGAQGPVYFADQNYAPGSIRLSAQKAPDAGDLRVDIKDDGISILSSFHARMTEGNTLEEDAGGYTDNPPTIQEGSEISFHFVTTGGAENITCTLELESVGDDG